jgi:hypothetical protein
MVKRVVAGVLWFYTVASIWNGIALASGWPAAAGLVLGALVAVVVWADPLHLLAPPLSGSEARPAERRAGVGALDRGA